MFTEISTFSLNDHSLSFFKKHRFLIPIDIKEVTIKSHLTNQIKYRLSNVSRKTLLIEGTTTKNREPMLSSARMFQSPFHVLPQNQRKDLTEGLKLSRKRHLSDVDKPQYFNVLTFRFLPECLTLK